LSEKLTPREREVLQALAEGLSDKEIAQRLHLGVGTVHSHVTNILSKLEVSSRLQALVFAVRHGVVTIE
jgi:DNA-binding NarL/FixJ family response regulator